MERHEILEMMGALQLSGMRAAYDEIVSSGVKRQQGFERVIGALLKAEIAEKQARSIRYQMGSAKLPLAKELADIAFEGTPINEQLVHDLAGGAFLDSQRNVILIGGTGTGKSHIAIAIARSCIRAGRKARFFNVVDLVNKLEAEIKAGRQGRIADGLTRVHLVILDELGYLPSHAIYAALRERILSNDIGPGTRLVMRDVANQYEASDIPVREALRMLERDGLVETTPYRGARVTTLTAKEVEETYFIRSHLESIATGLAAERITDAELAQLDRLMIEMTAAVDAEDGPKFSDLNLEFHRTIVASCGNDMLRELTMDIWRRHSGFQRVFRMIPGRIATSQREHEGIMAALRDHDAERASTLALLHKRSVRDSVSTLVDQIDERRPDPVGDGAR